MPTSFPISKAMNQVTNHLQLLRDTNKQVPNLHLRYNYKYLTKELDLYNS